ncbi:MAG: SUMF1/EgtB/PvdO family nonheme iron enzyme, partial [Candidatus Contendobacter sp.]|nr:SUMF1/EgtB/PvdO family nonheme iron enzyme [Candidatus Contendobacter sp.]
VPQWSGQRQTPIVDVEAADNFVVAYYAAGAKSPLPLDLPPVDPEEVARLNDLAGAAATTRASVIGNGAIAQGPGATATGAEGVAIGGNHTGNINTGTQSNVDTGGGAYIGGNVDTGGGKFVARDDHSQTVVQHYHGPDTADLEQAEATYRRCIASRCEILPLQSVDSAPAGGEAEPLSLAEIYVGLDTRQSAPVEVIERALANAARGRFDGLTPPRTAELSATRAADTRPVSALEAAILNRHLVLTGEPGSGKSTFLDHLTHALALRRWDCLADWPEREREALPVPVLLREFARWLATPRIDRGQHPGAGAGLLWDYLVHDLKRWKLDAAVGMLDKALAAGRAVVLFDGLDEVPADDEALLTTLMASIRGFVERYRDNRHLVTCRVLSYQEPHWRLPAAMRFPDLELARFNEEQIDRFIDAWYREVGTKWRLAPDRVATLAGKLRQAVRRRDLWRLAPNPLLLTVMALVHSRRGELPEKRALLYDEAVDVLLQKREQDKAVNAPQIRELLDEAGRDFNDLKGVLERLAFDTHGGGTVRDEEDGAPIDTLNLLERVAALHPKMSYDWARQLLAVLGLRASLLLERKDKVYSFPHRTFQEFLAGVHLARFDGDEFARRAAQLAGDLPTYWREVVLLAVGYLVHSSIRDVGKPRLLVEELCPEHACTTALDWRKAWLAGDVLREVGVNRVRDTAHGQRLLERVANRLAALVERSLLSARERAEAGDVLGELGDPRFDPTLFFLPSRYQGQLEPKLGFIEISAGPFVMGSRKIDPNAYYAEFGNPKQLCIPYTYWIARYPVTVAQYQCFVEDRGYENPAWWTETGWSWRQGKWDRLLAAEVWQYQRQARPAKSRAMPFWWDDQILYPNRPVMGICWFEALAYCGWLNDALRRSGKASFFKDERYLVRLPTEAEWEKAARNGDERRYPWGDAEWDEERGNIDASDLGHPTPVGIYPQGATPWGLYEASGNLWEWTLSQYRDYPYQSNSNFIENEDSECVIRGGSWENMSKDARCACRGKGFIDDFSKDIGFRIVVSLAEIKQ